MKTSILPKKDQTASWALEAISNKMSPVKLNDISKKLWSKEVIELAVLNGKADLGVIPQEERTYELCMAALMNSGALFYDIPAHIMTHEFLLDFVSRCPRRYDMAVTMDTELFRAKVSFPNSWEANDAYWETPEAVELAMAALCPMKYGQRTLGTYDRFIMADEAQKQVLVCKELGASDHMDSLMLFNALSLLLQKKKDQVASVDDRKKSKNTLIRYLYRDSSNYKKQNSCVIPGEMAPQQWARILATLEEECYFIPSSVGIPEERFEKFDPAVDHAFFELAHDFELTDQPATVQLTAEELACAFERCMGKWHELAGKGDM